MNTTLTRVTLLGLSLCLGGCGFGLPELLIILAIVLLLFGATKLPRLARSAGEAIAGFRDGVKTGAGTKTIDSQQKDDDNSRDIG